MRLSRAKHRSIQGHPRFSRRLAALVPFYEYTGEHFFRSDCAPSAVADRRRSGFERLACRLQARAPDTIRLGEALETSLPDLEFTTAYRVPFQFRSYVKRHLKVGPFVDRSAGVLVRDLDGNDATERDPSWTPFIDTPMHPEYPCAHCIVSSSLGAVLEAELGGAPAPTLSSESSTAGGAVRTWRSVGEFVQEVAVARNACNGRPKDFSGKDALLIVLRPARLSDWKGNDR